MPGLTDLNIDIDNEDGPITDIDIDTNNEHGGMTVTILFSSQYGVRVTETDADDVTFELVSTHHGFAADASPVTDEKTDLHHLIGTIRTEHPDHRIDEF